MWYTSIQEPHAIDPLAFAALNVIQHPICRGVSMKKGLLQIIGLSKEIDVTKSFLVHLLQLGTRRPHICVSEYDLANCLTDIGILKGEVSRLVTAAKLSGTAKTEEIWFSKRQVHKYWSSAGDPTLNRSKTADR